MVAPTGEQTPRNHSSGDLFAGGFPAPSSADRNGFPTLPPPGSLRPDNGYGQPADPNDPAVMLASLKHDIDASFNGSSQLSQNGYGTKATSPRAAHQITGPSTGHELVVADDPYYSPRTSQETFAPQPEYVQAQPGAGFTSQETAPGGGTLVDRLERQIKSYELQLERQIQAMIKQRDDQIAPISARIAEYQRKLVELKGGRDTWTTKFKATVEAALAAYQNEGYERIAAEQARHAEVVAAATQLYGIVDEYTQVALRPQIGPLNTVLDKNIKAIKDEQNAKWDQYKSRADQQCETELYRRDSEIGVLESSISHSEAGIQNLIDYTEGEIQKLRQSYTEANIQPLQDRLAKLIALRDSRSIIKQREFRRLNGGPAGSSKTSRVPKQRKASQSSEGPTAGTGSTASGKGDKKQEGAQQKPRVKKWHLAVAGAGLSAVAAVVISPFISKSLESSGNESSGYAPASVINLVPAINKAISMDPSKLGIQGTDNKGNRFIFNPVAGSKLQQDHDPVLNPGHTYANFFEAIATGVSGGNVQYQGSKGFANPDTVSITGGIIPMKAEDALKTATDMKLKFDRNGSNPSNIDLQVAAGLFDTYASILESDHNNLARYQDKTPAGNNLTKGDLAFLKDMFSKEWGFDDHTTQILVAISKDWTSGIKSSPTAARLMADANMKQLYSEADAANH